jgi:Mn2+/Fe2+ NRAMP family transporter
VTATVGTTLAPWGLAFIQSYAVDKRLGPSDLALQRVDVIAGAVMMLAAAILPLSTAYSVSEALGRKARVEASVREEPIFYGTYALVVGTGALVVLVPGAPLVPILFITQAINAVLLLPLLGFMALLTRDGSLMGEYATGRAWTVVVVATALMIAAATVVLGLVLVAG